MPIKNDKIKPAGYIGDPLTPAQIKELYKCARDPIYFIKNYVYIQNPMKGAVKFDLYDYQENLIQVYDDNKHVIALLSRQCGKTETAAAYILWWAIFKDTQRILIASKDHDGAKDIMSRLWYAYEELPWWIKPGNKVNQVHTKEFDNGSKIVASATTATSGRGKANSLIYLDEFAFVRPGIANDFWTAIYPTISTGGRCIITSTPNTDEDKFAQIWFNAKMSPLSDTWKDAMAERSKQAGAYADVPADDYETMYETEDTRLLHGAYEMIDMDDAEDEAMDGFAGFHAHWRRVPTGDGKFRDEKFKRKTFMAGLTEEEWLREYECAFISGDSTLFSPTKLATLRSVVRPPRFVDKWGCRWYEEIQPNTIYGVVMDPSLGVGLDDSCIQVWEIPSMLQVAEWNSNMVDQTEQTKMLKRVLSRINWIQQNDPDHNGSVELYYSVERDGLGVGILQSIEYEDERTFPGYLLDSTMTSVHIRGAGMENRSVNKWRGLITSVGTKKRYCAQFKDLVERNLFTPRSKHLASQMKTFVKHGESWGAKEGSKDDIVMGCVLMCHLIDEIRFHEPDLDDMVRVDVLEGDYDADDWEHPDNMPFMPVV